MPVDYQFYDGRNDIIWIEVRPPWTWIEVREVFLKTQRIIDEIEHTIHFIVLVHSTVLDNLLMNLEGLNIMRHNRVGKTYIIGGGSLLETVIHVMKRIKVPLVLNFEIVHSVDEALHLIDAQNSSAGDEESG